jgi:four helix bundle protein
MRRAAVSITSNIAEGFSRQSYREKIQFYYIAQASLTELQNQLLISKDIGLLDISLFKEVSTKSTEANKILSGLIRKSKSRF